MKEIAVPKTQEERCDFFTFDSKSK